MQAARTFRRLACAARHTTYLGSAVVVGRLVTNEDEKNDGPGVVLMTDLVLPGDELVKVMTDRPWLAVCITPAPDDTVAMHFYHNCLADADVERLNELAHALSGNASVTAWCVAAWEILARL